MNSMPSDIGWIQTFSGGRFYPLAPEPDDVKIVDVAHALSLNNRFTGHALRPYSVGEHSLLVVRILMGWGQGPETLMWGLMHDASEAYISDIARPLKVQPEFKFYRDIEKEVMDAVAQHFRLELSEPAIVKEADTLALAIEAEMLMPQREKAEWAWLPPIPEEFKQIHLGKPAIIVEEMFLKTYIEMEKLRGNI
jgi:hypothetical protein